MEQSRGRTKLSPTPWCSSYWKGSLRVVFDYGCWLYLLFSQVCFIYCLRTWSIYPSTHKVGFEIKSFKCRWALANGDLCVAVTEHYFPFRASEALGDKFCSSKRVFPAVKDPQDIAINLISSATWDRQICSFLAAFLRLIFFLVLQDFFCSYQFNIKKCLNFSLSSFPPSLVIFKV